MAILCLFSS